MQLTLTFVILAITIFLFMTNKIRSDLVAVLALLALVITGILEPAEALAGFSNNVVIMIAGLFVVGAGLMRTGLAQKAGELLLRWSRGSERNLFFMLLFIVGGVGAFMSNTGVVALMLPVVISIALSIKSSPSKYLIPLSFAGSLSGLLTFIASPPNLIASQTLGENGFERLGFFQITPIGLIALVTGVLFLYFTRNFLLPDIKRAGGNAEDYQLSPKQLAADYELGENLFRVRVPAASPMVGKALADLKIPANYQLYILKIDRKSTEGINILPMTYQEMAGPSSIVQEQDILSIKVPRRRWKNCRLISHWNLKHVSMKLKTLSPNSWEWQKCC